MTKVKVTSRLDDIAVRALRDADSKLEASARRIADGARARAPRRTGALAETIDVAQEGPLSFAVVADIPWRFLEFGTVKMGARPFMTPAAEAERDKLNRGIGELFKP